MLRLTFSPHGDNHSIPGIHDSLSEGNHIVKHVVRTIRLESNASRLLQDLYHDREIGLEMLTNRVGNIAKALQYCRLELIA